MSVQGVFSLSGPPSEIVADQRLRNIFIETANQADRNKWLFTAHGYFQKPIWGESPECQKMGNSHRSREGLAHVRTSPRA
jgi:hypothetical protein